MRDIKFRIFDEELNEMCEVYGLDKIYVRYISKPHTEEDSMYESAIKNVVLMQYTGLKDKNGKEIYEGDIVKMLESGVHEKWASIKAVEFDNKYLGFSPFCYLNFIHSNNIVEVIGNIYENKELLK